MANSWSTFCLHDPEEDPIENIWSKLRYLFSNYYKFQVAELLMINLSLDTSWFYLLGIHCLNGTLAAIVANYKGYNFLKWLLYGSLGGTVSLVWAIFLPKK
ncbi:MAG: hypothetical protein QNJ55_25850 [Xenococcus sp. MO_188.B8]|nr:hypothetical protein [Xenococcus sp. MO_188.B8]